MEFFGIHLIALELLCAFKLIALTGMTLYITLTGYAISTGAVEIPFWSFAIGCMKAIVFMFFCLEAVKLIPSISWAMKAFRALSRIRQSQQKTGS